mgnify:FL=1
MLTSFACIPTDSLASPTLPLTLRSLAAQDAPPDKVIIAVPPGDETRPPLSAWPDSLAIEVISARRKGTASQRNALLAAADDADAVHFFDSDVELEPTYLRTAVHLLSSTSYVGIGGDIRSPLTERPNESKAVRILRRAALSTPAPGHVSRSGVNPRAQRTDGHVSPTMWMSGGAMSVRTEFARHARFPECLEEGPTGPYAMAEDVHFSLQLHRMGPLGIAWDCRATHLGDEQRRFLQTDFWQMKGYSRMILARDFPDVVTPGAVRYGLACDLAYRTVAASRHERRAAQVGLTRALVDSFRGYPEAVQGASTEASGCGV